MRICYKFPTRSRPDKFFQRVDEIISLSKHDDYFIAATLDSDDESMNNASVIKKMNEYGDKLMYIFGTSTSKINACNRDLEILPHWDIIFLQSDDMRWVTPGFDKIVIEAMKNNFPDLDGAIHCGDQMAKEKLITYSILGRKYFERFNYLYEPSYFNVYVDNEFTEVSKLLGKYFYINSYMLVHSHPAWGLTEMDDQYKKSENPVSYAIDKSNYDKRKSINFDL
jgi:hypothetical protein